MTGEMTVILGIDTETDMGSWYYTYEGVGRGVPLLLATLTSRNIPATFFVTGDAAQKHPDTVRVIVDAGFEVGCHTIYHETVGDPLFEIPGVTPLLLCFYFHLWEFVEMPPSMYIGRAQLCPIPSW